MFKRLFLSLSGLILLAASIWLIQDTKIFLFQQASPVCILSIISGALLATIRSTSKTRRIYNRPPERHSVDAFLEHWGIACGILVLIVSGIRLRAGPWGIISSNLHFLGLTLTLFFGTYFLVDFFISKKWNSLLPNVEDVVYGTIGKYLFHVKWEENTKYLSSQKSAFLLFMIIGSEIVVTGAIKLAAIFWSIPNEIVKISTSVHDVAGVLLVILILTHVVMVVASRSRRVLLRSWFTGEPVKRDVVEIKVRFVEEEENLLSENKT